MGKFVFAAMQEKYRIDNRKGEYMTVLVERPKYSSGLVFIAHGLGGWKEQTHLQAVAEAFLGQGFTVVRYDATNSVGEAGGKFEDASATSFYEDLEDVIAWASEQDFYREPFYLAGHSLGGMAAGLFAERHSEQVKALLLLAPVVSGELSFASPRYRDKLKAWHEKGYLEMRSATGEPRRLQWSHVEDRLGYDLTREAARLTMPTLIIVGSEDNSTPREHQEILRGALPEPKRLEVVSGAGHNFDGDEHLERLKEITGVWIPVAEEEAWEGTKSRLTRSS
jgi:pimeloyl-ACP methyl ester carboxylesterase